MTSFLSKAEAQLNSLELKIAADYGSTSGRHPSDIGQEISDAPESVEQPIIEGGELFNQGREHAHTFAEPDEVDEGEEYIQKAFESYEEAVDNHLDYQGMDDLVDVDLVIDQAVDGQIEEGSVVEAAGLQSFVVDDLESDQSHVRRNMEDEDAYEFLMDSEYDTETVVRNNYMQTLDQAQQYADEALDEFR